jgi:hypothetical protein
LNGVHATLHLHEAVMVMGGDEEVTIEDHHGEVGMIEGHPGVVAVMMVALGHVVKHCPHGKQPHHEQSDQR